MSAHDGQAGVSAHDEAEIVAALVAMDLAEASEHPTFTPLVGGVSSDIWRVELRRGGVCVKRALAQLRVAADWHAPVERNAYEAAWMVEAAAVVPAAVPRLLGQDTALGLLVMDYLDPSDHPLWKSQLAAGVANAATARQVANRLVRIHAATAGRPAVAAAFPTDRIFHDIRLEPYLLATGRAHPDLTPRLTRLVETTAATKVALVHGDVSPKNILVGPSGPVFLDAECAWYGDPAFDLAFCANHLLLKCLLVPAAVPGFLGAFDVLTQTYLDGVDWEPAAVLERRAAHLLPGLFLARVDGKSPVEYVTKAADRDRVRTVARRLLGAPVDALGAVREAWTRALAG